MADLQVRGYGEMSIGGQLRPFHLGTWQARRFCEQQRIELADYQKALREASGSGLPAAVLMEVLLWSALQAGAKFKKLPLDFDVDDVSFWIAEAENTEVAKLLTVANSLIATGPESGNGQGQPAPTA